MEIGSNISISDIMLPSDPQLREARSAPAGQAADEVGSAFESLFASLLLKEMRESMNEGGLFAGDASDTLGGLFDMYMGEQIGQSGGLGVARMVKTYLDSDPSGNS